MGRFVPAKGLDEKVARMVARPAVDRIADEVLAAAAEAAPPATIWQTMRDDRVRPSHQAVDGQTIPANLRFILPHAGHHDLGAGRDLARAPRDENLPPGNREGCRCITARDEDALRRGMSGTPVEVTGTRARARVECVHPRVVESEFPDAADGGGGWMRGALHDVARKHRGTPRQ